MFVSLSHSFHIGIISDNMKRLIKQFLLFLKVDWIDTIRLNLFYLPFKQGKKIPILLFKAKLYVLNQGVVKLCVSDDNIKFGMIKLGVNYAKNVFVNTGIQIDLRSSGSLIFHGSGIMGNGSNIVTRHNGTIEFGRDFRVSGNFSCCSFEHISIGSNLSCSWGVSIYDTDFHETINPDTGNANTMTQPVIIGNNCWLCQKCTLLKGAKIPDWTTVGALAMVNRDFSKISAYTVLAGIPAKVVSRKLRRTDQAAIAQFENWDTTCGLNLLNPLS